MSWFANLPPEIQAYLWGAAADGTGGLVAEFATRLIAAGGARLRKTFADEPEQSAVRRAMIEAVSFALQQWPLEDDEAEHYQELFREWLLSPVTAGQFTLLLSPREHQALDIELLQEEFEATGLSVEHLALPFAELIEDMAAAFYLVARDEVELQPVITIGLLEKMVDQGGALARMETLMVAQVSGTQAAVDELKQIKVAADQIVAGSGDTNALLRQILTLLDETARKPEQPLQQQIAYQEITTTLSKIELLPEEMETVARGQLLDLLIAHFNLNELARLAFRLNINFDSLDGYNLNDKAMSLIGYMERRGRLPELVEQARQLRPQADWSAFAQAGTGGELDQGAAHDLQAIWERLDSISQQLMAATSHLDEQSLQQLARHYCQLIIDQFEMLTFQGLAPSGTPIALPLSEVYVELKAVAQVPEAADTFSAGERRLLLEMEGEGETRQQDMLTELDALRAERWRDAARQGQSQLQRRSIQETLNSAKDQGVVILGDPGSGKTTLLHYLALQAAQDYLAGDSTRLPIFLSLAAYDDHLRRTRRDTALGDFLAIYYERWHSLPGLKPLFDEVLAQGEALVLLDGLDEVLEVEMRRFVAGQVDGLMRRWLPVGNRFALSSRIVGYREAPLSSRLPHVTIVDFGSDEVKQFATQWCLAYELWLARRDTVAARQTADRETRDLLRDIGSNSSLERLAASPLLITMLALLRRHVGQLPDRRVELYQQYTRTLIDNWEITRSYGARQQMPQRFDPHQAIAHLMELALWLQQHKASGTARRYELEAALTEICLRYEGHDPDKVAEKIRVAARQQAADFLRDMRYFAGLLAERGRDAFGFLHLTFQEYFVGRALAKMTPEARWILLQAHLHNPRWREPILLCAGQLGVVEQRRELVTELTQAIITAESEHEGWLHRDKFLAVAIAADNVALNPAMLDKISLMLQPLTNSPIRSIGEQAWQGLAKLAQLNHQTTIAYLMTAIVDSERTSIAMEALRNSLHQEACHPLRDIVLTKLDDENGSVRRAAVIALTDLLPDQNGLVEAISVKLDDPDAEVRRVAISALAGLLPNHGELLSAITARLDDPEEHVRGEAIIALTGLLSDHPDLLTAFIKRLDVLQGEFGFACIEIINALAGLLPDQPDLTEVIASKLDDPNDQYGIVCGAAIIALTEILPERHDLLAIVITKLDDTDDEFGVVRSAAITALVELLPESCDLLPRIIAKLNDSHMKVRSAAITALESLLSVRPDLLTAITSKFDDTYYQNGDVRHESILSVVGLLPDHPDILEAIIAKLDDPDEAVRSTSILALGNLLPERPDLLALITAKLNDPNGPVRAAAINTLAGLLPDHPDLLAAIITKLDEPDDMFGNVRSAAISALGGVLPEYPHLLPLITAKLDDTDVFWEVASTAISALGGVLPEYPHLLPLITAKLDSPSDEFGIIRVAAIVTLGKLLPNYPDLLPLITAKLDDSRGTIRGAAISALAELLPDHPNLLGVIIAKLDDPNDYVRSEAIMALTGLLPDRPDLLRVIITKLDDPTATVRSSAISALAGLLPARTDLQTAIISKLDDPSGAVRRAAVFPLLPLLPALPTLRQKLIPWLGCLSEVDRSTSKTVRQQLASALSPLLTHDDLLVAQVATLLDSLAWPARQGAAWALMGMPGGPPADMLPRLKGLLTDFRSEESWPQRLQVAEVLLNHHDPWLDQQAIAVAMEALDYATQPWYSLPRSGTAVRRQAALILGQLDSIYFDEALFNRLRHVMEEDKSEEVRDAAYQALLRMATVPKKAD